MVTTSSKEVHTLKVMKVLLVDCLQLTGTTLSRTHSEKAGQETPTLEISTSAHPALVCRLPLMRLICRKNILVRLKGAWVDLLTKDSLEVSRVAPILST